MKTPFHQGFQAAGKKAKTRTLTAVYAALA
jgi:hypothetical protein